MTDHPNLAAALVAALSELTTVEKGRKANAGSYSYDYADLGDIVNATRPVLAEHGVVALTPVHGFEGGLACTVELVHASGETKKFDPFPFPAGRDAQATGSMVTYHRRYALLAALGMATGEDDDGAAAMPAKRAEAPLASGEVHEQIRNVIACLTSEQVEQFGAWYRGANFPSIKTHDSLTESQAKSVLKHLDSYPAAVG